MTQMCIMDYWMLAKDIDMEKKKKYIQLHIGDANILLRIKQLLSQKCCCEDELSDSDRQHLLAFIGEKQKEYQDEKYAWIDAYIAELMGENEIG